jgi:hypothetical protein
MPVIPIPVIISGNGIADSIFRTAGLWVILVIVILIISLIYGLLKGDITLPRIGLTAGKIIAAVVIAAAGIVAFSIFPLLVLPLLVVVLAVLVYREVKSMNPNQGPGYRDPDPVSRERYFRQKTSGDRVINAEFRVVEPEKEKQARPVNADFVPDAAGHRNAEEQRLLYEEQKKRELAQKLREREMEQQQYINGLSAGKYREYLQEAEKFQKEFGKNVKCDVCGRWDEELFVHHNQTYCPRCLPGGSHPGHDSTVVAGKHGAPIDQRKK